MKQKKFRRVLSAALILAMLLSALPIMTLAADITGATNGQPFSSGTGGSTNFRIPALITLSNGNLLAAADARYTGTGDGYGLDTVVSYSTDKGSTWNYSYVNYFDDSAGYNGSASAFIDPVLIQGKDGAVYLFTDLFPGDGHNIAIIESGTGFTTVDGVSYLALYSSISATSSTTPAYYVANERNSDGYYTVYNYSSKTASNYALDAEYDIYTVSNGTYSAVTGTQIDSSSTTINANVFYTGTANQSGLYVLGTEYITMRKGTVNTDGSIEWGNLQLLNVKNSGESFYGFGPGGGIVTSTGRIIVPLYTYANDADGNTSVIYSDDNGATWTRSADMNVQTSEASISEVTVGGTNYLYMFTRHGGYFVSSDNGATWSTQKSVSGISYTTTCELSTLTYSKLIDGCPAILLSAPTSDRTTGKIFVGLVQSDETINWKYTYQVNSGTFQYSDLTELPDGSIGLLYENGSASITYTNLAISTIASGATIGEEATDPTVPVEPTETKEVTIYVGQTYTDTIEGANYSSNIDKTYLDESIATVSAEYTQVSGGTTKILGSTVSMNSDDTYTGLIYDGNGNYLVLNGATISSTTDINEATEFTVTRSTSGWFGNTSYTIAYNGYYLGYTQSGTGLSRTYTLSASTFSTTSWSYSSGFSINAGGNRYLRTNNGTWELSTTNSNKGQLYSFSTDTTASVDATTVTIYGVTVGETSVVVGNTTYNITVKEIPPYVDAETTPFTVGTSHTGAGEILTKLTLSVGLTYDIDLASNYSGGTWSIADTSIATVDQDGKVTGVATGETTLTYTASNGVVYNIPVVIVQNTTSTSTKICSLHITEITNTTVWYSWNCSGSEDQFIQAVNGEAIYVSYASNVAYCINIYGAPEEGYALTFMSATNSSGQYLALQNKTDPTQCDFYTQSGAGKNERDYSAFGDAKVAADIQAALNLGCDGAQGFSRNTSATDTVNCDLTFRSQKLPTVEKTIVTVGDQPYTEGMTAKAGDVIVYNVTVTQYATTEAIVYTNEALTDNLSGAQFTSNSSNSVTPSLSDSTLTENKTTTYQVTYTIQDSDLDKDIINTVDLTYSYSSAYSSGTFGGSANAKATIFAPTFTPDDIVVDFGLPVTIDYSGADAHGRYDLASGTATYGDVTVSGNKVTYTPKTVFPGIDTVTLTNTAGGTYTFKVVPASNVLYEDGFMTAESGSYASWTDGGSKGNGTTNATQSSANEAPYGYDVAYVSETGQSNTAWQVELDETNFMSNPLTFTLSGAKGLDVIGQCGPNTGILFVNLTADGKTKVYVVYTDLQDPDVGTIDQVPLTHIMGLDENTTYSVKVFGGYVALTSGNPMSTFGMGGSSVLFQIYDIFDAMGLTEEEIDEAEFIGFDNLGSGVATYTTDNSITTYDSTTTSSQTVTVDGFRVYYPTNNSAYATEEKDAVYTNVVDSAISGTFAAYVEGDANGEYETADYESKGGPENEIYLPANTGIVFKLENANVTTAQISARAVSVPAMLNGDTISSNTEMYYSVDVADDGSITIVNNGGGMLALGNLKAACGISALAEKEIEAAPLMVRMMLMAAPEEPEEPEADPVFTPEKLDVKVKSVNVLRNKLVTVTITASTDVAKLTVNGKELKPTNSLLVKLGWSKTYTYVLVDTVTKTASKSYEIIAYNADGLGSEPITVQG